MFRIIADFVLIVAVGWIEFHLIRIYTWGVVQIQEPNLFILKFETLIFFPALLVFGVILLIIDIRREVKEL